jgi:hypothetical protein
VSGVGVRGEDFQGRVGIDLSSCVVSIYVIFFCCDFLMSSYFASEMHSAHRLYYYRRAK